MYLYSNRLNHFSVLLALTSLVTGCSFSDSSESVSDLTSSIISSPSSFSDNEEKYENEVSDYTMAYVKSSEAEADYSGFRKGLSDIAAKRGISNWDQESSTYIGIGKGLKKAGVSGIALETYKTNFANANEENIKNIQKGYDSK